VLVFLNRHEDAVRQTEIFLPLAPTAPQPYLLRGVSLYYLDRYLESITCLVIGLHLLTITPDENPKCRVQFNIYLAKAKAGLEASGTAHMIEAPLPAPPNVEEKGGHIVEKKKSSSTMSSSTAVPLGSFDEDADARGFMRSASSSPSQASSALQITLHGVDPGDVELKKFLQESLTLAASALAAKKFNLALSIYRQVLEAVPNQPDALRGCATVYEYHQRWHECFTTYNIILSYPETVVTVFDYMTMARVCLKLKKVPIAANAIEKAQALLSGKQCDASVLADLQALRIKTLLAQGEREEASSLVISSLQKDDVNIALLMIYAEICTDRGQFGEAVKVYLRCLVIDSTNVAVRRALSQTIQRPNGVAIAMQELSEAAGSGPALAFMATLVKDYSAIDESLTLYKRAVEVTPNSPSYSLNLIHTYELCHK
jgi:tetratricopeptide (TPR) repeat protein